MTKSLCAWGVSVLFVALVAYGAISETVLHSFSGGADGRTSWSGLVADASGNLYGTTGEGGGGKDCYYDGVLVGCGVVYELMPNGSGGWNESVIEDMNALEVINPVAGLVSDKNGNLYGTATQGSNVGGGGAFELSPSNGGWTASLIYAGVNSSSPLILDGNGNLFGVCFVGSFLFELSESNSVWNRSVLLTFNGSNGNYPYGSLSFTKGGNLVGTTTEGGAYGYGTVFALQNVNGGWSEKILYSFTGAQDGAFPYGGPLLDGQGNIYGTTAGGGTAGFGAVYELSHSNETWTETVLYSFNDNDGAGPVAPLIHDSQGNLYGTTVSGGASDYGTVFALKHSASGWAEVVLHSFAGGTDGAYPYAPVFLNGDKLYGTTSLGGASNYGTAYQLSR